MMDNESLKQKVRDILNEHGGGDVLQISTDHVMLDDYIDAAIKDAVTILGARGYRVNIQTMTEQAADNNGAVTLPENFISLSEAKMQEWNKPVVKITEKGEPAFVIAMNKYTPPGVNSPICFRRDKLLYCLPKGSIEYIDINVGYDGETLNAQEREATAVAYMAAALVMGFFEDDNGKQRLSDIATQYLQ